MHFRFSSLLAATERIRSRPSLLVAFASLTLHLFANGHYGFFRDELYFIVCGSRPDWGYVDQPPVVPLLAAGAHAVFGDWLLGFRLLPALVMALTIALTAEFARLLGGGRFAQWVAALAVLTGPIFLITGVLFYTDMFQALSWLGLGWALVRLEQTGDERWWLVFGAIAGLSLETKYLVAFYLVALGIGLVLTPQRKSLARPYVYLGACMAALLVLPNVLWQAAHGWPFLQLGRAAATFKNLPLSPRDFLVQQVVFTGPVATLVWLCGAAACLMRPRFAVARAFAVAWFVLFAIFDASHGKAYYLCPIYPTLLAFGGVRIEEWLTTAVPRAAALAAVVAVGVLMAPLTLPILPVASFLRYQRVIGFTPNVGERLTTASLPQYYADMFGWPEMASRVAAVYRALPPEDRSRAVFFGNNYGEAAAIDVFGRRLGLPPAISGHNNYYLWGPRGRDDSVLIIIGGSRGHYESLFRSVEVAGRTDAPLAMPYEADQPIYVLRGMRVPLQAYWPQVKNYQ